MDLTYLACRGGAAVAAAHLAVVTLLLEPSPEPLHGALEPAFPHVIALEVTAGLTFQKQIIVDRMDWFIEVELRGQRQRNATQQSVEGLWYKCLAPEGGTRNPRGR